MLLLAGRNSLVVQWLGLSAFTAEVQVPCSVGELGSQKPHSMGKLKKKTNSLVMCVPHIFLESTVTDGSAERLSILPNVKRSKDLHSSILLTTRASGFLNWGS